MKYYFLVTIILVVSIGICAYIYNNRIDHVKSPLKGWSIIIPGITGDLAKRKLIPALYRLSKQGMEAIIIGTGRRDADIAAILNDAKKFIDHPDDASWDRFTAMMHYHKLDPHHSADFDSLALYLNETERRHNFLGNRLVYLALPSSSFCDITQSLVTSGIIQQHKKQYILYEKPFGIDAQSAQTINKCITSLLPDDQLYRVDHYVAKGMVQALPELPSKNSIIYTAWRAHAIESIKVVFHESIDIEGRGAFYDSVGAIKDVIQNHALQLLAFTTLDLTHAHTRKEREEHKAAFLRSLRVIDSTRGQYEGYRSEKDVSSESTTETYAAITLKSSDERWKDVTFIIEAGKALPQKKSAVIIRFSSRESIPDNQLTIQFAPKDLIALTLQGISRDPVELASTNIIYPEAYEALFADVLTGAFRYAVSFKEILAQWLLVEQIVANPGPLTKYNKGQSPTQREDYSL